MLVAISRMVFTISMDKLFSLEVRPYNSFLSQLQVLTLRTTDFQPADLIGKRGKRRKLLHRQHRRNFGLRPSFVDIRNRNC